MKKTRNKRTRVPGLFRTPKTNVFPNGGWEIRYKDLQGGARRKTFPTRQAALDFQAKVRTDKKKGTFIDPQMGKTPFRLVAKRWLDTIDVRPTTRAAYESMVNNYLIPRLGHYSVAKITPAVVRTFMAGLPAELSGTRKRHIFRVLSPIMGMAVEEQMIPSNPCREAGVLRMVPKAHKSEMKVLKADQVAILADTITPKYRTLVLFAAYTGVRASEIAGLKKKHVDLMKARALVIETVTDVDGKLHTGPTKNAKARQVNFPRFLVDLLMEQIAEKDAEDYVFGTNGKPLRHSNFYSRHFKPALVAAGLPDIRFHDLRHTCAALLIDNGEHPKAISEQLGHSSVMITLDRYGHLFPGRLEEMMDRLNNTFQDSNGKTEAPVTPLASAN